MHILAYDITAQNAQQHVTTRYRYERRGGGRSREGGEKIILSAVSPVNRVRLELPRMHECEMQPPRPETRKPYPFARKYIPGTSVQTVVVAVVAVLVVLIV